MNPETIKFYGFDIDNNRTTPEHRMWISVLITFIDELIGFINDLHDLEKRIETYPHKNSLIKSRDFTLKQIKSLIDHAKSSGTKNICELIDIDHRWFCLQLVKLADDKNLKSRPIRQIPYDV